ncbi:dienelactone hydrolase family protein [Rhodovulum sp. P5]|uniref:dienelactone hydrolase family protein n=1 Tax=Rhodovulum sp. P5 TaxID=1564506 RepID=UPI0009C1D554|nr:dienelactone hydrolase family protein [Rhodovulum sp. P5]ARE38413.1 dienelactone hydrolase family protein [Rhodovulum sp. P5]
MKYLALSCAVALAAGPARAEDVPYDVGGVSFTGYFAAAADPKGLVLIVHDWDGMTDYERKRADMLAELGYDAFALDMFGDGTPTATVDDRRAATGALYRDRARMRALIKAGSDQARALSSAQGMITAGYCFGGAVTLEMARSDMADDAVGFASFHGGLSTPEGQGWDGGEPPLLILHGGADSSVKMTDVAGLVGELEAAGTPYEIEIYSGAPHAFTVFGSDRYREVADRQSWDAFTGFLKERLGG